jgi:hypothetical protein
MYEQSNILAVSRTPHLPQLNDTTGLEESEIMATQCRL